MCTAICYNGLAGRTLDLEYSFAEEVVITPIGWRRKFIFEGEIPSKYALVGMAHVHLGVPLYYDAASESGLYMAALNFPKCARYREARDGMINLASAELIPYILGRAGSLSEARELLSSVNITPHSIADGLPATPLHWLLTDGTCSLAIEPTERGLEIIENPFGVLTNSPEFAYNATKIADFAHISPTNPTKMLEKWKNIPLYSRGMGALGLPGDYSSTSRFVRAAFLNETVKEFGGIHPLTEPNKDKNENIFSQISEKIKNNNNNSPQNEENNQEKQAKNNTSAFFHITDSLAVPYGAVLTDEGAAVYTVYTSCADLASDTYHFTTYACRTPHSVALTPERKYAPEILRFPLPFCEEIYKI